MYLVFVIVNIYIKIYLAWATHICSNERVTWLKGSQLFRNVLITVCSSLMNRIEDYSVSVTGDEHVRRAFDCHILSSSYLFAGDSGCSGVDVEKQARRSLPFFRLQILLSWSKIKSNDTILQPFCFAVVGVWANNILEVGLIHQLWAGDRSFVYLRGFFTMDVDMQWPGLCIFCLVACVFCSIGGSKCLCLFYSWESYSCFTNAFFMNICSQELEFCVWMMHLAGSKCHNVVLCSLISSEM